MNIKQLSANPRNPRKISKHKLTQLAKSMIEHGPLDGFIYNVRTKRLAGGHQRQAVMPEDARVFIEKRYDKTTPQGTIASGYVDYMGERWPYREVDWDENKEKAANIAANKGAGEWDLPKLQEFVLELDNENFDLDLTMFDSDELKDLFGKDFGIDKSKQAIEDEVPDAPKDHISKLGDLYELGDHRLLCGDSTDKATVERLMNGEKADMVFTDPPYGVSYEKKTKEVFKTNNYTKITNDDVGLDDLKIIFGKAFRNIYESLKETASYYFCSPQGGDSELMMMMMMRESCLKCRHQIIWVKDAPVFSMGRLDYDYQHEPILYGWVKKHYFQRKGSQDKSVWNFKRSENKLHPTMKPVELIENALLNSSVTDGLVIDIFGGSGSTLIACEKTKRKCYMMELDPHYIDVIVSRWCKYTGKTEIKRNGEPMTWNINTTST